MTRLVALVTLVVGCACAHAAVHPFDPVLIDERAIGYGTFQSHNQKVLANAGGIFMTHVRTRNEAYTAQQWRLSRSTDGGKTFATIYEATHGTHPPCIETDEQHNVYLVRSEFGDGNAYLHTFLASQDYKDPRVTPIPHGAAQKFGMFYDAGRRQLYYASHHRFDVIALDGTVRGSQKLLEWGKNAEMQYPILSMDRTDPPDPAGVLHFAWTTVPFGKMTYRSIHFVQSPDGGATWRNPDGAPLTPPVVADDTGPAHRVNRDDELPASNWLASFLARNGKAHFLYLSTVDPPRQHYVRYDLRTAKREFDIQPAFKGDTIELFGLDGFFAASDERLYCVGHTRDNRVGCLASDDNGTTWRDHALSTQKFPNLYAVGGARNVTAAGDVIGSFTDSEKVYFFKIPGR